LSLIKEALDKAQEEGSDSDPNREVTDEPQPNPAVETDPDTRTDESDPMNSPMVKLDTSTIITSVIIIILAALIGGQIVLLASVFLF